MTPRQEETAEKGKRGGGEGVTPRQEVTAEKGKRGSDYLTGSRSIEITAEYYEVVTP